MYTPKKSLGQNFLVRKNIGLKMVESLNIQPGDQIIEIGPGLGALTEILVEKTHDKKVEITAVEIDERFVEKLNNMFLENLNLTIIKDDVLKWFPKFKQNLGFKIIGSLPYYITSPIIHMVVKHACLPSTCVFLIQKEVAVKIKNLAPDGSYFSNFVNAFFNVNIVANVPRKFFKPVPKVDSAVILLTRKATPLVSPANTEKFSRFLHKAFSNPRKMLNKVFTKEELELAEINPGDRPQHISVDTWVRLFNKISN